MFFSESLVEVRYAETDQMGVVHHATYIIWFEIGRTKFCEALGLRYTDMENDGYYCPVLDVQATYKQPLHYGETATVRTSLAEYRGARIVYSYEVMNQNGDVCVTGTSSHVLVTKDTFKPVMMRKVLPDWHEIYMKVAP